MYETRHLMMFYKMNRNWETPSPSAGKLFYSEYTVQYGYNAAGNGGRECTPKRMPATAGKHTVGYGRKPQVTMPLKGKTTNQQRTP